METINIRCGFCGNMLEMDEAQIGTTRKCPACGKPVEIVNEEPTEAAPPPKSSGKPSPISTTKECPVCGAHSGFTAFYCSKCGYGWRAEPFAARGRAQPWYFSRSMTVALLALIVVLLAYIAVTPRASSGSAAAEEQAAGADAQTDYAGLLLSRPENAPPARDAGEQAEGELVEALLANSEPAYSREELAEMADRYQRKLTAELDKKYPAYSRGDKVVLRMSNGLIHRGTYLGVKKDVVVLVGPDGDTEIPVSEMDRESRVRGDTRYRQRVIDAQLRQHMQNLRNL